MDQRSPEWFQSRLGRVTASSFAEVMTGGKGKTRESLMLRLLAERLTGEREESFTTRAMQWGIDHEDTARSLYEIASGLEVEVPGYIALTDQIGGSPDGLVGSDGIIEIKCPSSHTHLRTMIAGKMPDDYLAQVHGYLWITGRQACDFVSYDPRMPSDLQLCVIRVDRDEAFITNLSAAVTKFADELVALEAKLRGS